jgi:DnaJ-class molecular chaperone
MPKLEIIRKVDTQVCWACDGAGKGCKVCKGTGKWKETHYIHIVGNLAIDGDTIK